MSVFKRLLPYVRPYWSWLVAGGLLAIVVSGADGLIAWLVKPAMDEIFIRRDLTMLKLLPLLILGGLRRQGRGAVRPVVPDGLRRRAGDHRPPARSLRAHPGHAARLLPGPALRRPHVPRRGRRQPPGPPVVRGPGHGVPAGLHRRRAPRRHGHAGGAAHAPRPDRLPPGRAHDPLHGPAALLHQPADAGADRRAEHGPPGGARRHQDRQGLRPRGARAGSLRPGQPPAARAVAEGPPRGRAVRAPHGDPRRPRADGHPLVRGLPGDPGRHDARHALLLRDGHPDALRPRAQALPDRQPRPADHARPPSGSSRSSPSSRRSRTRRTRSRWTTSARRSSSTTSGSATRTARWRSRTSA